MAEADEKTDGGGFGGSNDNAHAVDRLVERFGGIRPMAAKLDIPVTTVQGWKKRSAIPATRHNDILAAAEQHGISLDGIDLTAAEQPIPDSDSPAGGSALRTPSLLTFIVLSGGALTIVALALMFIGLYIVKQKTADLSHRINMVEQNQHEHPAAGADGVPAATIIDLQQRIADLNAQVSHLSAQSQKNDDPALGQTVSGLQQTIATLQSNVQGLAQSVDGMRNHMGEIDTAVNQKKTENARAFATLLAIDQLREAADTSEPFDSEVTAAKAIAQNDADVMKQLNVLANYSGDGAPTLNELRVEFSDLAGEIVRSNVVGSGKSWMRQALYRLGSVVSVRKIGPKPTAPNTAETLVARAESRLEEDDLAGAVATLQGLDGLPKDVAGAWIDSAQRRLAVDEALTQLSELSLKQLSLFQSTGTSKP
jgi:hypothetical protein